MKHFNLAEYLKNPERKIVTRGGYPATIVSTTFHQENYPIVAEVCFLVMIKSNLILLLRMVYFLIHLKIQETSSSHQINMKAG